MKIIIAIIIFSFIIIFHELGHFLAAKKCNVKVNEFTLGLGPTILSWGKGETKYCLKLLPFGGSCVMEGEDGEGDCESERSFNNKTVWERFLIVVAGPVFNFILAYLLSIVFIAMAGVDLPIVRDLTPDYPAAEAGILAGDEIVSLNGYSIHFFSEIGVYNILYSDGEDINVEYVRDGKRYSTVVTPKYSEEDGRYKLGVEGSTYREKLGIVATIKYGFYEVKYQIYLTIQSLRMLFTGQISVKEVSGPVGVVNVISSVYDRSILDGIIYVVMNLISIAILLSANLGVMNLLPLPALDGGRLLLYIIEIVRGKKMNPEIENGINLVGFSLLMLLMIVVMYNDIIKLF